LSGLRSALFILRLDNQRMTGLNTVMTNPHTFINGAGEQLICRFLLVAE
jgi:hypothetical protein